MNNPNYKAQAPVLTKFTITNEPITDELKISNLKTQSNPSETTILIYLQLRQAHAIKAATRENIIKDTHLSSQNVDKALIQLQTQGKIKPLTLSIPQITIKPVKKSQLYPTTKTTQHHPLHKLA